MHIFSISTICAMSGLVFYITGLCNGLRYMTILGFCLMIPEIGNEFGLWKFPIHCEELQIHGCIK